MKRLVENSVNPSIRVPHLWLAASNGRRLPGPHDIVARIDEPELPLEVEFVGLTPDEQQMALAGFPGGQRFVLKSDR